MRRPTRIAVTLAAVFLTAPMSVPSSTAKFPPRAASAAERPAAAGSLDRLNQDLEALSRKVTPAVVEIFSTSLAPAGEGGTVAGGLLSRERSSGSGVLVDPSGYIVTNAHVVEGARRIQVLLNEPRPPGRSIIRASGPRREAKLVGLDHETDLAVIKIEGANLPTLSFGDSDLLHQGQLVMAFGSPLGLENSVSLGVISSAVRQIEPESPMIYLQTDAAIHPGNSGGPLVDVNGAVVGINTFLITSPASGSLGFAAPSNIVSAIVQQLRQDGRVRRGEMGARAQTLTPELAQGFGLAREWGVILSDVYPGGPAERAGLRAGDVVASLDGKPMENGRQLDVNLYRRRAGDPVSLEILRDGQARTVQVTLVERTADNENLSAGLRAEENLVEPLHILGIAVDEQLARRIPMRQPWGVIVALSTGEAPPGGAPLLPGDIIRAIGGGTVRTLDDLRRGMAGRPSGSWVTLHVERNGRMIYVPVEAP